MSEVRPEGESLGDGEWEIHPEKGVPVPKDSLYEPKLRPKLLKGTLCYPGESPVRPLT
jgi:hypothetical protein